MAEQKAVHLKSPNLFVRWKNWLMLKFKAVLA